MSEDEARGKWCPFARVGGIPGSEAGGMSFNRWGGDIVVAAHCVASDCMAWRWCEGGGFCGLAGPTMARQTDRPEGSAVNWAPAPEPELDDDVPF